MLNNKFKKGVIFTITVFIISAVLLDFTSYISTHNDRQNNYFLPPSEGEILNSKLWELSSNSQRALGVKSQISRNSTHLTLSYQDSGFPFHNSTLGRVDFAQFKSFYEGQWESKNDLSVSINPFYANSTGIYYQSSDKINYSHINSVSSQDQAKLAIPNGYDFDSISMNIFCRTPQNASSIRYDDWTNSGTSKSAQINYSDTLGNSHLNSVLFSQSATETFEAAYYDSLGNFLQKFTFNLQPPNYTLEISSQTNDSYGWFTLTKQNVSCSWNLSTTLNYSNSSQFEYYIPITSNLIYQNSSYSGNLPVSKN